MVILIIFVGGLLAMVMLLFIAARIVQTIGLITIAVLGAAVIAVGYISLFIAGISLACLYQLWGSESGGWAVAVSGLVGLTVAAAMLRVIFIEIRSFLARLKNWLAIGKTASLEKNKNEYHRN